MNSKRSYLNLLCLCLLGSLAFSIPLRAADKATTPAASASHDIDQEGISTGKYIASGIVGTAVGLGIGHGIQGRYFPLGLVFSIGEAAGWVMYAANVSVTTSTSSSGFTTASSVSIGTVGVIGLVTVLGLHVWETIDIWVTGTELHKKWVDTHPKASLSILPISVVHGVSAPGLTVALSF